MTPDTHEIRLEEAGRRAVPPPDAAFADRLDAHLRVAHADRHSLGRRPRQWRARLALAATAVIAAVALAVALIDDDPASLTLTAAVATDVVLPDGTVVPGRTGLALPDGSLVRTGAGGSASAGGVLVPAGATAVVTDGALVLLDDDGRPTTSTSRRSPSTIPPSSTRPTTPSTPTTGTAPAPTSVPTTIRPPVTTTAERLTTSTVIASTTTVPPIRLELRASRADPQVLLSWSAYERPDFARYVVVRIQDDRSEVVAERTEPTATSAVDQPPPGRLAYRVVALDGAGRVVGGSPIVSPS